LSRFMGRSESSAVEETSVIARDHGLDLSIQEMEFNEFSQLQQIPPFNINKVDQFNFFGNDRN